MADNLPAPLVPPGVILRDFPYMPVDVVRLRDSRFAAEASAEAFRCGLLLWCVSWHQVPAASLPDDDLLLAGYAGFGRNVREWKKHRKGALHGWVLCSDGRLYHPVVAEKATEAQLARDMQAYRTECARLKKVAQRAKADAVYPSFDDWLSHYRTTGSSKWSPQKEEPAGVHDSGECPEDTTGTNDGCPEMSRSKGREGKGREGISISCTTDTEARLENPERARQVAGALRGYGYGVQQDSLEVAQLVGIQATDGEIQEAAAKATSGWLRNKPVAWIVSRITGRRSDAQAQASTASPSQPAAIDPGDLAKRDAAAARDNAIIDARHLRDLGLLGEAEFNAKVEVARTAYAAAIEALEAAA